MDEVKLLPCETGWLIEEDARGITHWIALAEGAWPRTTASTHPFASSRYKHPVERVKDANQALRFSRKQDAEAFIKLFERFLLDPVATEHEWPRPTTVVTDEIPASLQGYNPRVYRGFIITHEDDGPWRVYSGEQQRGWAQTLEECHEMVDRSLDTVVTDEVVEPIPMMLFCPKCGLQHIDAPDERTPEWTNPPHKSHLCHGCGTIWRPADVPTEGVAAIQSRGSKDTIFYNRAALASMPAVVTGEQPLQSVGDYALPCSASSPVTRSRPKAAPAIARKGDA